MNNSDRWIFAHKMVREGHTQKDVAKMLKVSPTTVGLYLQKAVYELERRERAKDPKTLRDLLVPTRVRDALYNSYGPVSGKRLANLTFDEFFEEAISPQWLINRTHNFGRNSMVHLIDALGSVVPDATDAWIRRNPLVIEDRSKTPSKHVTSMRVKRLLRKLEDLEHNYQTLVQLSTEKERLSAEERQHRFEEAARRNLAIALGERLGVDVHWSQVMQDDHFVYYHNWEYPDDVELYQKPLGMIAEPWDDVPYAKSIFVM